jgi:excinuclease UvrABC nuclease subunit
MVASGWSQQYLYTDAEVRRCAPTTGGVYRLMYAQGGQRYVFYVGESATLEERLLAHLGAAEPDACIRRHLGTYTCYFDFVRIGSESERKRVEAETIRQFNPPCNS